MGGSENTNLNLNTLLCLCSGEGANDAFGSSTRDADRQPSDLGGDGAGPNLLITVLYFVAGHNKLIFYFWRY